MATGQIVSAPALTASVSSAQPTNRTQPHTLITQKTSGFWGDVIKGLNEKPSQNEDDVRGFALVMGMLFAFVSSFVLLMIVIALLVNRSAIAGE